MGLAARLVAMLKTAFLDISPDRRTTSEAKDIRPSVKLFLKKRSGLVSPLARLIANLIGCTAIRMPPETFFSQVLG